MAAYLARLEAMLLSGVESSRRRRRPPESGCGGDVDTPAAS